MRGAAVWGRPEQAARLLAREIPLDAAFVALVHGAEDAVLAARAADAIAAGMSRRREHILLASCEAAPASLDELLGGSEAPGFAAALQGEARLTETAVRREDRLYVYLPAGRRPAPPEEVAAEPALASLVRRVRERGGTLLVFGPDHLLGIDAFVGLLDGYVSLGDVRVPSAAGIRRELARVRFRPEEVSGTEVSVPEDAPEEVPVPEDASTPEDAAPPEPEEPGEVPAPEALEEAASGVWRRKAGAWRDLAGVPGTEAAGAEPPEAAIPAEGTWDAPVGEAPAGRAPAEEPAGEDGSAPRGSKWRRHRQRSGFPYAHVAAGLAIVVVLAVGWWALASTATPSGPLGAETEAPGSAGPVMDLQALLSAVEGAPELPYSVLIASYAAVGDARNRVERLRRAEDGLFFIAPTPVRGAIYHRVFAGARPEVADGRRLMGELVEAGRKETASDWDVRPAGLAYRLGVFVTAAEASEAVAELEGQGVPTYIVPAGTGELRAWQVYAGAYESEAAARPLAAILERAGLRAELVARRGEVR